MSKRATVSPNSHTLLQLWEALGSKLIEATQGRPFYIQEVRGSSPLPPTISLTHLAEKPGDPLLNSLTCSTRDWENLYLFVYPFN